MPHADQFVGAAERQRLQHDAVDDAEDRGDGTDADRRCRDGDGGKGPIPQQRTPGVVEVAPRIVQPGERPSVTVQLFHLIDAPHGAQGGGASLRRGQALPAEIVLEHRHMR